MANVRLYPPYGTLEQSSSIKFEINGINEDIRIEIDNVTDNVKAELKHFEKIENGYAGVMDLNIPEHSSQSSISVFFTIYKINDKEEDEILQIYPSIFEIKEEFDEIDSNIIVSPSFIGQKDICSIKVKGDPLSSSSFSINDKILKVKINEAGYGSIHFKGSDIVGNKELESISKVPVYVYEGENKTSKVFSGSHVNILPSNIAIHAVLDPRCDPDSDHYVIPGTWEPPEHCDDDPCDPTEEVCDDDGDDGDCNPLLEDCDDTVDPPVAIPVRACEYRNVDTGTEHCRIYNYSSALMNNGMVMHAYISPDKEYKNDSTLDQYNINRVFLAAQYTSPSHDVLSHRDVVIEPKSTNENLRIHVEEDVWNLLSKIGDLNTGSIYIVFYNAAFGYQSTRIIGRDVDEYTDSFVLIAESGSINVELTDWVFCVNAVIYDNSIAPENNFYLAGNNPKNYIALPFVRNEFESGDYVQPVNISIATNYEYVGKDRETYIYVIVEAITENNLSQLYFNSFSFGKDSTFDKKTYGWVRLTNDSQGNNKNPVAKMDSYNNLHVVFESDRGGINQLYYGNIGINSTSIAASVFSSSIDKYSEFLSKGDLPFDYFSPLLLKKDVDQEYFPIPEFDTQSVLSKNWNFTQSEGGNVTLIGTSGFLDDLLIKANPLSDEAMAITSLKIVEDDDLISSDPSQDVLKLFQFNYQISFDLEATITQDNNLTNAVTVSSNEMDSLFSEWKSSFTLSIDPSVTNQPVYKDSDNNKYVIGRYDNIYDRIVPLVGSYKYQNATNPSFDSSQIKILENDNNLKDYTFGIIFEKTYMKATNIQTADEYVADGNSLLDYNSEIIETIFTGKAKMVAFIKTKNDDRRAGYIIVREFPEELNINESSRYDVLVNYTRIDSEQIENTLNTYDETYTDRFIGSLTFIINEVPKFSQSFITDIDVDDYNYFDIGFGMPSGGYYIADKMSPSKLGVYDNVLTTLDISNITISSPTYTYNDDVVSMSPTVRKITDFKVFNENILKPDNTFNYVKSDWEDELISLDFFSKEEIKYYYEKSSSKEDFEELFNVENVEKVSIEFIPYIALDRIIVTTEYGTILHDSGFISALETDPYKFDVDVTFIDNIYINIEREIDESGYKFIAYFKKVHNDNGFVQIPVTYEGINQSAALDMGSCGDVHLAWQSNKNKYWDIYYTNSVSELSPFRHETQITNTESNSIRPDISVSKAGKRMIVWNDNREGNFTVYTARSLSGYDCNQKSCESNMLKRFENQIEQCSIEFSVETSASGIYNLVLYLFSDINHNSIYKIINLEDNLDRWFFNGVSSNNLVTNDSDGNFLGVSLSGPQSYTVTYKPGKDDGIFDIILYTRMDIISVEEGV